MYLIVLFINGCNDKNIKQKEIKLLKSDPSYIKTYDLINKMIFNIRKSDHIQIFGRYLYNIDQSIDNERIKNIRYYHDETNDEIEFIVHAVTQNVNLINNQRR